MSKYLQFPGWQTLYRNVNVAVYSGIIGSLVFSVVTSVIILYGQEIDLSIILFGWIFISVIASIPAVAGGTILSCLIFADVENARLSKRKSIILGVIVGSFSTLSIILLFLKLIGTDSLLFVLAFIAILISAFSGAWSGRKIFEYFSKQLSGNSNE